MNDEYAKGYQLGQEHANRPDRKKRPMTLAKKVLSNPITLFSDPHNNEFQRGYHQGYEDGIRVVNVQTAAPNPPTSTSTTPINVSTMTNTYAYQHELQNNLKGWLHRLPSRLASNFNRVKCRSPKSKLSPRASSFRNQLRVCELATAFSAPTAQPPSKSIWAKSSRQSSLWRSICLL